MERLQAYRFELRPDGEQQRKMRRFAGACRFVYNRALALQKARYAAGEKKLGYSALCREVTAWRNSADTAWLRDAPIHPLQQALRDLDRAYQNFFAKRAAFPRFRKKGRRDSFRYPDPKQFKLDQANNRLFLPKLGWVRYRNSRDVLGTARNVTVSERGGKWFVSIQCAQVVAEPTHPSRSMVGVDLGIAQLATCSDGMVVEPFNSLKRRARQLARAQRSLARKRKGSSNYRRQKAKIARLHIRIADARQDHLHKITHRISQNHAVVCVEDLQVANMSRSASGTVEAPGKQVSAKRGLNRAILDQGWFELRRQLGYKLAWAGGQLVAVAPQHTSQRCSACGHVSGENRRSQSRFCCVACGHTQNADLNAAMNILAAGHAVLACGGDVSPAGCASTESAAPAKQEPTEATQAAA